MISGIASTIGLLMVLLGGSVAGFIIMFLGVVLFFVSMAETKKSLGIKNTYKMKTKTTKTTWIISGIIIFFIIIVIIINISNQNNYSSQTPKKINTNDIGGKIDLHVQAQQFVFQGLKAPSTAKFPALPYEATDLGNGRYKVVSYVDSENSFGAMIRSDWYVIMKILDNLWTLERMVIDGKVVYDPVQEKKDYEEIKKINAKNKADINKIMDEINQQQQLLKSLQP